MTKRKKCSLVYKLLVIASLSVGITLNLINTSSVVSLISYYTLQSNIICLIAFICYVFMEIRNRKYKTNVYYLIKGAIVVAILITAIVYRVALAPTSFEMDSLQRYAQNKFVADLLVHTVSPLLVLGDYLLFDKKGKFRRYYPFLWLIIPFNYVVYVYTFSFNGGEFFGIGGSRKYAYFFLDYDVLGKVGVLKWMIVFAIVILVISYLLVIYDYVRGKKTKKKKLD